MWARMLAGSCCLLGAAAILAGTSSSALAASSSIALNGPHTNVYGSSFKYIASGAAKGPANHVWGWEVAYTASCASTYKTEASRGGTFLFVSQAVTRNHHFSVTINFSARNTEKHRFCAYLTNKGSGKTYAHASTTWTNVAAGTGGSVQPAPVGSGQCQAKRFPDESAYAQIAISGVTCELAEAVGYGADAAKGASYSSRGYSCTGTAEAAGSMWAAAWTGTYYAYTCSGPGGQFAFNWGTSYAYVPASTLPTITAPS